MSCFCDLYTECDTKVILKGYHLPQLGAAQEGLNVNMFTIVCYITLFSACNPKLL